MTRRRGSYQKLQDKVFSALTDETKQQKQKLEGRKKLRWCKEGTIVKKTHVLRYKWCTMLKSTLIALFAYVHRAVLSKDSFVQKTKQTPPSPPPKKDRGKEKGEKKKKEAAK